MILSRLKSEHRRTGKVISTLIFAGMVVALSGSVLAGEKSAGQDDGQVCRVLFLGDNAWHGGTLRRVFEACALAQGRQVDVAEVPAKGRPLGEIITGLLENRTEAQPWDVVVVFDHPLRILVQRDRDELVTEIHALQELAPKILWLLLPYQKITLRGETERREVLARLGPQKGFATLPLFRIFYQTAKLAGGAPWVRDLISDRPTSLSDYVTACLLAQVIWGTIHRLPNDIRISDTVSVRVPEEALPVIAKVLSGPEVTQLSSRAIIGDFAPELTSPRQILADRTPLTLTAGAIPGFLDWNGDQSLEFSVSERVSGQFGIWRWQNPAEFLSLTQEARFPAGTLSPEMAKLLKAGATIFQIVDFDHDRRLDLLIGTNDRKIIVCRGQPGMVFGPPETFQFENGKPLQVPYLNRAFIGELTKDGIWDLVVGDEGGQMFYASLIEKEGHLAWTQLKPVSVGGLVLQVEGEASPILADWDLDGLNDLIVGSRNGSVLWLRNIGSGEQPNWAPPVSLVWPCEEENTLLIPYRNGMELWAPTPGWSTQPAVGDLNGDHLPDLVVGDSNCRVVKYRELSPEERKEIDALLKKRVDLLQKIGQSPPEAITTEKAMLWETTLELIQKSTDRRYERCGWLWYFQRQSLATPDE
jgi:hypothetical protein